MRMFQNRAGLLMVLLAEFLAVAVGLLARQSLFGSPPASGLARATRKAGQAADALGDALPAGAVARLGTSRLWHEDTSAVTFSPDGNALATLGVRRTSTDSFVSTIIWWDAATGRLLRETTFPNLPLTAWVAAPDGKQLALGVDDAKGRRIALWDVAKGEEIDGPLMKHIWRITYLAFLPDGKTLVSRDDTDNSFHFWNLATRKKIKRALPTPPRTKQYTTNSSALSSDGKRSAWYIKTYEEDRNKGSGRVDGEIIQVVEDGGKILFQQDGPFNGLVRVAISPDGRRLAWAADREHPRLIDIASKETQMIFPWQSGFRQAPAFSPDGKFLACQVGTLGGSTSVELWDVEKRRSLSTVFFSPDFQLRNARLAFTRDGKTVAVSAKGVTRVYDSATGKERVRLPGHRASIRRINFSRDGKSLYSSAGTVVYRWQRDGGANSGFQPSPKIRVQPVSQRNAPQKDNGDDVFISKWIAHALYSPDLSRKVNESGIVLDIAKPSPQKIARLEVKESAYSYWSGQISPDNQRVLLLREAGRDLKSSRYEVFDAASGKRIAAWPTTGLLNSIFSADGRFFAWQDSENGRLLLGDLRSGKFHKPFSIDLSRKPERPAFFIGSNIPDSARMRWRFDAFAFSPDNHYVAAVWNSTLAASLRPSEYAGIQNKEPTTLYVADTATGAETARIVFEAAKKGEQPIMNRVGTDMPHLTSLAFTRDGRTLAAGYLNDADVHLIEVASGRQRAVLHGHRATVRALALSPDGRYLVSGGDDTALLVWDLDHGPWTAPQSRPKPLALKKLNQLWEDLDSVDATVAFRAIETLRRFPEQALPLLKQHLHPMAAVKAERINQLIRDLDSGEFTVRSRATRELETLAELAQPALKAVLEKPPSLEVRLRLRLLVERANSLVLSPERLRSVRAVEVLEAINSEAAREHLEKLARGVPQARLTREAKESLRRLTAPKATQ